MAIEVRQRRERPVNLNLFRFHFPVSAVTSITHRLTGAFLFLGVWALLYLLHVTLGQDGWAKASVLVASTWGKSILIVLAACAGFHLVAGFKHLLMDLHIGETLKASRILSWCTWAIAILLTALAAYALW